MKGRVTPSDCQYVPLIVTSWVYTSTNVQLEWGILSSLHILLLLLSFKSRKLSICLQLGSLELYHGIPAVPLSPVSGEQGPTAAWGAPIAFLTSTLPGF